MKVTGVPGDTLTLDLEYVRDTPPLMRADCNTAEVDADGTQKKTA